MALSAEAVVIVLAATCFMTLQASGSWNYDDSTTEGPSHWDEHYPTCGGSTQSPINIVTSNLIQAHFSPLTFAGYESVLSHQFSLVNNGHSAQVNINDKAITVSGGGLGATYVLEQLHFHWGDNDGLGSEHTVDGSPYPLEIHLVHFNGDKYTSVSDASSHADDPTAIAVFGVFVAETTDSRLLSNELASIITHLTEIPYEEDQVLIDSFALSGVIPCDHSIYRYNGSLTTPGCAEVVNWNVFRNPIYLTAEQVAQFRALHANMLGQPDEELKHNYRPVQPVNTRTVYIHADEAPLCPSL